MPLIKLEHIAEGATFGIWRATESIDFFLGGLSSGYMTGYDASRFSERRKKEFLASRFLLKHLLGNEKISLEIKKNGQTVIAGDARNISISHSKDMAVAIVSNTAVGIDIEEINMRVKRIMHKFLNEAEQEALGSNPELWKITLCWSAKESIYKMMGKPGLTFSNDIMLEIPKSENGKKIKATIRNNEKQKELPVFFEIIDDFVLTYCMDPSQNRI